MPLIVYPSTLPPPSGYPIARREGRALPQGAGNEAPRARMRDAIVDADTVRWRYTPAEMAVWREWFHDTLLDGQLWFAATLPGRGGWLPRVARYIGEQLQLTHLGAGIWEVSCRLELRGLSVAPATPDVVPFAWSDEDLTNFSLSESNRLAAESVSIDAVVYSELFGTGKRYVEVELVSGTVDLDLVLGISADGEGWVLGGMGVRDWNGAGASASGVNEFRQGSNASVADATTGTLPSFVGADRVCIAVDFGARQLWIYPDGVPAGAADPATGDEPTFEGWQAGLNWRLFARADNDGVSHQLRLYGYSDDTYLYGPPAGFTAGGS